MKKIVLSFWLFSFFVKSVAAADPLTLEQSEMLFMKNNFSLIAEQFNISVSKAQEVQAAIWPLPEALFDINAYAPDDRKFLHVGQNGQKAMEVQQLVLLGGKKKAEIELARSNTRLAELYFKEVLRNLRFSLHKSYLSVYYDAITINALTMQMQQIDTLVKAYRVQADKGNIPLKDLVRLQYLYISLQNSRTELLADLAEEKRNWQMLMGTAVDYTPAPSTVELQRYNPNKEIILADIITLALSNRTDLAMSSEMVNASQLNYQWQRTLAKPDVTMGFSYDQQGGAFRNQLNFTIGMPIPLWNRNKGNIKAASFEVKKAETGKNELQVQVENDVKAVYSKYIVSAENLRLLTGPDYEHFAAVYKGIYDNFQRRNISLIEFTDFIESYHEAMMKFNQVQKSFAVICEEVNHTASVPVF
ncbi:MAG: TolC family protein [Chitinophagaceae bacterium]|nr:TolC family protein [Chitinophagaceae bacterium]